VRKLLLGMVSAAALVLSGCAASSEGEQDGLLAGFGLGGKSTVDVIDTLDRTQDDKAQGLTGSVGYDTLTLSGADGEVELPIPEDQFYLSVAPYIETTHECYYHNLASCQGELVGEDIDVTITDAAGAVLVDETVTTYENGFAGFWLPKDIEGTIGVSYNGLTAVSSIGTGTDDPTCLTTLQLG